MLEQEFKQAAKQEQESPQVPKQASKQNSNGASSENSKQGDKQDSKQQPKEPRKKPPKLGPRKSSKQPPPKKQEDGSKDGQDLTTILDESQRADFTLLLANATESMRKLIEDNFDASAGLNKALLRENMTDDEKLMSADIDPGTADVTALDRERKLKEQYVKELSTPKMKNLKKDALKAFDEWRQNVIERVGQVVNSERTAKGQVERDAKAGKAQPQAPDQNPLGSVVKTPANEGIKLKFKDLYPPTKTPLTKMNMQQRTLLVHSLLLLLLSLEHYNAPSRVLLLHLTSSLKLPLKTFEQDETTVAKGLLEAAKELTADEETKKKAEANRENRKWKVGLASAAGAAIIGISGGMAAPLVSAGVGTIMGSLGLGATAAAGYLGSVAGSTVLVGGLFGAYGGRMTGEMMDKYAREVEDFEFLPVHSRNKTSEKAEEGAKQATEHNHKLRVTICISGWLTEKDEVVSPWKVIGRGAEVFALKWELEALLNLGNAMNGLVQSAAWGYAQKQMIQQTIFADLMAAMWPIGLMKAAGVIDNPFSVAKGRSEKAGEVLADALINRAQGERPVTLIGYSLGARIIYTCLMSLAKRKAFGLVESAVLIGAPTPSDTGDWRMMRTAVSARLINVYSENDYVLGFMYRTSSIQYGVAGLQKVEGLSGVENVNVSEDVKGHLRYRYLIGSILKKIGFEDIDMQAVEEERVALEKMEEEEKKNSLRAQKNRLLRRESAGGKEDEAKEAEEEADDIQKQVAAKTQKTLVTRAVEYFYLPKQPSTKDIEKNLGNIQKAAADPSEAGSVAIEAIKDIQASGQSYAQWAAQKLPSLPGRGGGATKAAGDPAKAGTGPTNAASKTAGAATTTTQSYTQAAASYLPGFGGGGKKASKEPAKAAGDLGKGAEDAVKQVPAAESVKDTTKPAMDNATKTAGDVASAGKDAAESAEKKAEEMIDQTPAKDVKDATKSSADKASKMAGDGTEAAKDTASDAVAKGQEVANDTTASAQQATGGAASSVQKTAEDTASSAQSYTQRAAGYLPSLGGKGKKAAGESKKTVEKAAKAPVKPAGDTPGKNAASAESYTSKAAGYLPSFGGSKKRADDTAKKVGDTAKDSSTKASDGTKEPRKAAAKAMGTPSKTAEKVTESAKDAIKRKTPSVPDSKKAVTDTTSSTQSYTSRAAGYLPSISGRRKVSVQADPKRKGSNATRTDSPKPPPIIHQDSAPKKVEEKLAGEKEPRSKPEDESLTSRASGYLPSTPSVPGLGQGQPDSKPKPPAPARKPSESQKKPPKSDRKPSEQSPKSTPKLERKPSSVTTIPTKPAPKLERRSSEAPKSTPTSSPKLSRQASEAKKSIPKLERKPSGVDTPSPLPGKKKLERTVSGAQKSIPKLDRVPSGMKSPPAKLGRTPSGVQSSPASGIKSVAEKPGEVVGKGVKGLGSGLGSVGSVFGGGGGGGWK
jgi:Protein of unknown function (DUF726)